jgi:hypothetical protein
MNIVVHGNIINTEQIHMITPICGDRCWALGIGNDWKKHSSWSFCIKFLNRQDPLLIVVQGTEVDFVKASGVSDIWTWDHKKDTYKHVEGKILKDLGELRTSIAECWSQNKNPMPEFNSKYYIKR